MIDETEVSKAIVDAVYKRLEDYLGDDQSKTVSFYLHSLIPYLDDEIRRHEEIISRSLHKMINEGILKTSGSPTMYTTTQKFLATYEKMHYEN